MSTPKALAMKFKIFQKTELAVVCIECLIYLLETPKNCIKILCQKWN